MLIHPTDLKTFSSYGKLLATEHKELLISAEHSTQTSSTQPLLFRMESNSAHATSSIHSPDTIDVAETHTSTKSYHTAEITVSEDITLEKALEDEKAKELVANTQVDNPFTDW